MKENISINQVEKITGVSKRNIRFYEKEGLLLPKRNSENGYRVYDESDIWRIKVIKMLRMLDMPLEEIKKVLEEEQMLSVAIINQQLELERKAKELQAAISFIPEYPIITARHFTEALFEYANENNLNMLITKEGLYPEFTIDGVEYVASRFHSNYSRVPTTMVTCHRKDREIKGDAVDEPRKLLQWFIHKWGGWLIVLVLCATIVLPMLIKDGMAWEGIFLIICFLVLLCSFVYRDMVLHFNDKRKWINTLKLWRWKIAVFELYTNINDIYYIVY